MGENQFARQLSGKRAYCSPLPPRRIKKNSGFLKCYFCILGTFVTKNYGGSNLFISALVTSLTRPSWQERFWTNFFDFWLIFYNECLNFKKSACNCFLVGVKVFEIPAYFEKIFVLKEMPKILKSGHRFFSLLHQTSFKALKSYHFHGHNIIKISDFALTFHTGSFYT